MTFDPDTKECEHLILKATELLEKIIAEKEAR
jgi:hypothetical protein